MGEETKETTGENKETTLGDILGAIKSLTETVSDLVKEQAELCKQIELSRKAGKF